MSVDARVDPIGTVCPTRLALSTTERFPFFRDRALLATEHQVLSLNRVDCAPHITGLFDSTRVQLSRVSTFSRVQLLPAFIVGTGESARPGAARRSNQLLTRNSSCFLPRFAGRGTGRGRLPRSGGRLVEAPSLRQGPGAAEPGL